MGIGLSVVAILASPVTAILWLLGMTLWACISLRRIVWNTWSVALILLTAWSVYVAVVRESLVSLGASVFLVMYFLCSQQLRAQLLDRERMEHALKILLGVGTATAVVGLVQQLGWLPEQPNLWTWALGWVPLLPISEDRIAGTFSNPNYAGLWYAMLGIVALHLWVRGKNHQEKWLVVAQLVLILLALYFTGSRGGMFALVMGAAFLFYTLHRRFSLLFLASISSLIAVLIFTRPEWLPRGDIFWASFDTRMDIWFVSWRLFLEEPLLGYGLGNMYFLPIWYTGWLGHLPHAHSTALSLMVDLGWVGLLLFLVMQAAVLISLWALVKERDPLAGVLGGIQVAILAAGLVDHPLLMPQVAVAFFISAEWIFGLHVLQYVQKRQPVPLWLQLNGHRRPLPIPVSQPTRLSKYLDG